jgi:signal transduction histidine kinase
LNIRALLTSVAALVREDAASAGVRIVVDAGGAGEVVLRGDADQLRQALLNLVANAIEAMLSIATAARVVTLSACADARSVVLTVGDTGPGIPDALVGSAFEPFRSDKPQGMGLGLMISRTLVEAHGGGIAAFNHPAGGARFEITLPRQASHG